MLQGKAINFITCCVIYCSQVYTCKCGVLFICSTAYQSLRIDRRLTPHFLFVIKCHSWGWNGDCWEIIMKNVVVSYVQPAVEVIEIEIEKGFANSQLENPDEGGNI